MAAASSAPLLHVSLVTPARVVLEAEAASVVLPAFDGEWGLLPGHAAFLALLGCGRLTVTGSDGRVLKFAVRGGFLQVLRNRVTVLAPEALAASEMDAGQLARELELLRAASVPRGERGAHEQKLAWTQARLKTLAPAPGH